MGEPIARDGPVLNWKVTFVKKSLYTEKGDLANAVEKNDPQVNADFIFRD